MFAMICTRLDIVYVVILVNRYMVDPGVEHWNIIKYIVRYMQVTLSISLIYKRGSKRVSIVKGFVDAYYAGDLDKRRS